MRAKNQQGKSIMPELLDFYEIIKTAETDRLKVLSKEDPYYFEKTMHYAVAFNMLKEWTAKFEGLILQVPDWYSSSSEIRFRLMFLPTRLATVCQQQERQWSYLHQAAALHRIVAAVEVLREAVLVGVGVVAGKA